MKESNLRIPKESIERWQKLIDMLTQIFDVSAGLIMRLNKDNLEVIVSSKTKGKPYKVGSKVSLDSGSYSATVVNENKILYVKNALKESRWENSPDVKLNIISYLGLPLVFPNGKIFGVICILDSKPIKYSKKYVEYISNFADIINQELRLIYTTNQYNETRKKLKNSKNIENDLNRTREQLNATLNALPDLLFEIDRNGTFYDYRAPKIEELCVPPEVFIGKRVVDVLPPEPAKIIMDTVEKFIETGKFVSSSFQLEVPSGIHWFEITMAAKGNIKDPDCHFIVLSRNITERKRLEDELRDSRENIRITLDSIGDAVISTDVEGKITRMNPLAEQLTWWTFEEAKGKNLLEVFNAVNALTREKIDNPIEKVIEEGNTIGLGYHTILIAKDGTEKYIEDSIAPIHNIKGKIIGAVLIFRDITEKYQKDKEIKETKELYQSLFDHMTSGVAIYEAVDNGNDFIFKDFNLAGQRMEKTKKEDVIGRKVTEVFPGVKDFGLFDVFQRVWKTGNPEHHPISFYKDDKITGWRENYVYKLPSGEIVAVYDDKTAQKQAEEGLKQSEKRFRSIFECANTGIAFTDNQGNVLYINKAFEKIIGYTQDELQGVNFAKFTHPDDVKIELEYLKLIKENKMDGYHIEKRYFTKSGEMIWIDLSTSSIRNERGEVENFVGMVNDITKRKQAEDEIKTLYNTIMDGILVADMNNMKFLSCNQTICDMLGYSREELLNLTINDIHPEEDLEYVKEVVSRQLRKEYSLGSDIPVKRKDGSIFYADINSVPLKLGGKDCLLGVFRDITERKKMEDALRKERDFEALIMETSPIGIVTLDKNGQITFANHFAEQILGLTKDEITQRTYNAPQWRITDYNGNYLPDEQLPFSIVKSTLKSVKNISHAIQWDDGRRVLLNINASPLFDDKGEFNGMVATIEDVTARIKTEEALQRSEEKYRTLYSSMNEGVCIHELVYDDSGEAIDYRIIDVNPKYTDILGIDRDSAIGKLASELYGTGEPPYFDIYKKVAETGEATRFETYFPPMNKHFAVSVFSLGQGKFATIFEDITERKLAEKELIAKNKELEQIIYVASHDLRSPLVNVDGYSKELEFAIKEIYSELSPDKIPAEVFNKIKPLLERDIPDALKFIRNSTIKMDTLLGGLLKLSRSNRCILNIENLNMNKLLSKVINDFEFQIKQSNVKVEISDLPNCKGDAVHVNQVFSNLVSNALKYLEPTRPGVVRISGTIKNGNAIYCVEDNGIGIAKEHQEKIFEIFHRLEPSRAEGEGLGLTIVQRILGRLNGSISVESKLGEGSKFFVSLPKGE